MCSDTSLRCPFFYNKTYLLSLSLSLSHSEIWREVLLQLVVCDCVSLSGSKAAVDARFPYWTTVVHLLKIEDVGGVNVLVIWSKTMTMDGDDDEDG